MTSVTSESVGIIYVRHLLGILFAWGISFARLSFHSETFSCFPEYTRFLPDLETDKYTVLLSTAVINKHVYAGVWVSPCVQTPSLPPPLSPSPSPHFPPFLTSCPIQQHCLVCLAEGIFGNSFGSLKQCLGGTSHLLKGGRHVHLQLLILCGL